MKTRDEIITQVRRNIYVYTLHNYNSSALLPEDPFPRVDFLVLKTLLNLEKIMSRINHISNKRLRGRIRKERKLHSKIQIFNLTNTTCQQPCQIKTHLSLVHSHFPLRLSSFFTHSTFIRTFASLSRMSVSKYIYPIAGITDPVKAARVDDRRGYSSFLLCWQHRIYDLAGDLHSESAL